MKNNLKNATLINIIIVGIITVLIKGIAFFKEIVIADNFGLSELLDTFYIAILIPGFISNVFMGAYTSIFIPNYIIELKTKNNIRSFQSASFIITALITIIFVIVAILFTDIYIETFFDGHTEAYYDLVKLQFYYLVPCIILWGFTSLLNGLLTIYKDFTYSSLGGMFIPLSIIFCLFFLKEDLGVRVLAVGTLAGSVISFVFALGFTLKKKIIRIGKPDFYSANIRQMLKQFPAKISSGLLIGINPIVDQYFAAQLVIGSIAALNYGTKIPAFMIGIGALALGNVLLPYFSNFAAENKDIVFKKLMKILKYIIISSVFFVIAFVILSKPIVTLIFERNAFTSADTIIVSKIQQMYLLQIPFYISSIVMVKFLTSINRNNFMVFSSFLSLVLNIVFNYILIKTMGVYGLALATSLVYFISFITLYIYIRHLNKVNV
ncbi:polysaccharide biosynthesis C-terminal domain-containing protein [bacterium AH-315-P13]|nr:polysaccharide biosynthesis C-terminal domain-containing protein [bacterium AH-315-P13]